MKTYTILLAFFLLPFLSIAQETKDKKKSQNKKSVDLTEVVITADKVESKLQETPISASLIEVKKIENENINTLADISARIPNFFIMDYGSKLSPPVFMRGMGLRRDASPSVGLYVDNIPYLEKGSFNFDFMNIANIEILRGPQGTLYGRNTMGGLIKIYTQDPSADFSGYIKSEYGNYNTSKTVLHVNQPISKKFYTVFNAGYSHSDGFFDNISTGNKADKYNTYSGRIKIAYRPNNNFKATFNTDFERNKQLGYPYGKFDNATQVVSPVNYNRPSSYDRDLLSIGLNLKYEGKNIVVTSATSYQFLDDLFILDQDFSPADVFSIAQDRVHHTFYQEFNIHSVAKSKLKWLLGMMYFKQSTDKNVNVNFHDAWLAGKPFTSYSYVKSYNQPTLGAAAYGQASYPIGNFSFTAGARIDYESADLEYTYVKTVNGNDALQPGFNSDLNFNQFTPKFTISYLPCDYFTFYGAITKGFKAGGFNSSFESDDARTFDPEKSTNWEIGAKTTWLNNKLVANFTFFTIEITDQQVSQSVPSSLGSYVDNAAKSRSWGIELEINGYINDNWQIWTNFGYNKVKFLEYTNSQEAVLNNNFAPNTPRYTLSTGTNYTVFINGGFIDKAHLNVNYQHFGKIFWNEENTAFQKNYGLLNAKLTFENDTFDFGLWAKNIMDVDYNVFYFVTSAPFVQLGKPAQFGVFAKFKF